MVDAQSLSVEQPGIMIRMGTGALRTAAEQQSCRLGMTGNYCVMRLGNI